MMMRRTIIAILGGCWIIAASQAWAGLVFGPAARTQFEGFRDGPTADTFIDFNSLSGALSTQISGVVFQSNIDTAGNPFGPINVYVSTAGQCTVRCIVGTPFTTGTDDGRVGYQIVFATPQRRAGLRRNWQAQYSLTKFYNASGALLSEHANTVNAEFVGYIADGNNPETDWVKRIQIDGLVNGGSRQVGYSDDLFFGSAAVQEIVTFNALLRRGWNLIGNSVDVTLSAGAVFGSPSAPVPNVTTHVNSVWKWNATLGLWQFYSPGLTPEQNQAFADTNGFEVLTNIEPGLGYWVNIKNTAPAEGVALAAQTGVPITYTAADALTGAPAKIADRNLATGWQLVAIADTPTPSQFNENLSDSPPQPETVKLSFESLWAWDAVLGQWYFYAPPLEQEGGFLLVKSYADANGFLHFEDFSKTLGVGTGFWVRK